jgi:FkbM family methyltransferase
MNLGNVIRQQRKNVSESWAAYQELRHWAPIAEQYRFRPGLPFVCIDEDLERRCRMRLEPYFLARRVASSQRGPQSEAFNTWIRGGFGSSGIFKGDGFELEMPPEFPNARDIVVNDLREILIENRYANYLPGGELAKDGDVVVDCGGNIGAFTVYAATRAANVRVVAFEPEPATFNCLRRNVSRNNLDRQVTCVQAGVTRTPGQFSLIREDQCFTMHHLTNPAIPDAPVPASPRTEIVQCVTIDDTIEKTGWKRCDLIKMDIEGAELEALEGAAETIARYEPRLTLACYHKPCDPYSLTATIKKISPDYNVVVSREGHLYAFV